MSSSVDPLPLPLRALAPAKINLGLFVGPVREDGRHELVSVMQSIALADELTLCARSGGERQPDPGAGATSRDAGAASKPDGEEIGDSVVCPGVRGPQVQNLAARALAAFRAATGWEAPPLELTIDKHVPVAAGLGGGSGDAAAALRLAAAASGRGDEMLLIELAGALGADVPAQVRPARWLASGAGELLEPLPEPRAAFGVLALPAARGLSTAAVYAQADRIRASRSREELEAAWVALTHALGGGAALPPADLLENDLQDAARALCPEIDAALEQSLAAGADVALVSGSGPTVLGLFAGSQGVGRARAAADALAELRRASGAPSPIAAEPVGADFGAVGTAADRVGGGADRPMRHNSPR
jgi:4-diphosphocytidyl-2-C-methyl-D-erythritol kinase